MNIDIKKFKKIIKKIYQQKAKRIIKKTSDLRITRSPHFSKFNEIFKTLPNKPETRNFAIKKARISYGAFFRFIWDDEKNDSSTLYLISKNIKTFLEEPVETYGENLPFRPEEKTFMNNKIHSNMLLKKR